MVSNSFVTGGKMMNETAREVNFIKSEFRNYHITVFGPMSEFNGGPWAVHVRHENGDFFDAIYGCKTRLDAGRKAIASIREG